MTEKTFTFTIEQIKQIYQAGIRRGGDEQCAHDWGCRPSGKEYDELVDAFHDILNEGKKWGASDYIEWGTIEDFFKENA